MEKVDLVASTAEVKSGRFVLRLATFTFAKVHPYYEKTYFLYLPQTLLFKILHFLMFGRKYFHQNEDC